MPEPKYSRWQKIRLDCPEGRGQAELLAQWCRQGRKEKLQGLSCNNVKLKDLSGSDCHWSCWQMHKSRRQP